MRTLLILVVLVAAGEFTVRGPVRWVMRGNERVTDLTGPYLGGRAWLRGLNPYQSNVFWTMSEEAGLGSDRTNRPDDFESHTPYPLTSFVLLAPVAALPWPIARIVAMLVTVSLVLMAIYALSTLDGFSRSTTRRAVFVALALGLAPLHSSIGAGNPVASAVALAILAVCAEMRGRQMAAAVALGLAICLKPPIAAPVFSYYVFCGRWRIAAGAAATVAGVLAVGSVRMLAAGTPWLADYLANSQQLLADHGGAIIQYSPAQYQFINLQYLGYVLFQDTSKANLLAVLVGGTLLAAWLLLFVRPGSRSAMLEVSALAVISLLPIYHRVYDAALLLLPLAWILSEWPMRGPRYRGLLVLLFVPFLVPGGTLVELLVAANRVPDWVAAEWWWRGVIVPHQVWLLVLIAAMLLAAQSASSRHRPERWAAV